MEIWRIEGKIKFALTELEKLNLNNAEDKSKKGKSNKSIVNDARNKQGEF